MSVPFSALPPFWRNNFTTFALPTHEKIQRKTYFSLLSLLSFHIQNKVDVLPCAKASTNGVNSLFSVTSTSPSLLNCFFNWSMSPEKVVLKTKIHFIYSYWLFLSIIWFQIIFFILDVAIWCFKTQLKWRNEISQAKERRQKNVLIDTSSSRTSVGYSTLDGQRTFNCFSTLSKMNLSDASNVLACNCNSKSLHQRLEKPTHDFFPSQRLAWAIDYKITWVSVHKAMCQTKLLLRVVDVEWRKFAWHWKSIKCISATNQLSFSFDNLIYLIEDVCFVPIEKLEILIKPNCSKEAT